ncbi:MAG: class I SAM-dependent methyltransferase [Euryarchaeota archaeon]|nr:MAG: Ubiquinone/menaquinone biosynthesis C-methyltransferase UbiE [ANME-2 cluster archaeon]MEA1865589.1 class I SAM-dependent methyltransferase [Euryarchaeota archaeon]
MIRYGAVADVPVIEPFEENCAEYDLWFDENRFVYLSELNALRHFIRHGEMGVEIGVGTGRFAAPLGIGVGIDPSLRMGEVASERGISFVRGVAESLPFRGEEFDFALMMVTICFVDDVKRSFDEVYRVLTVNGSLIVGFIDKYSFLGRTYLHKKENSKFYRYARFYSVDEVMAGLRYAGFRKFEMIQTIFGGLGDITAVQSFIEGRGDGSFVVIRALK